MGKTLKVATESSKGLLYSPIIPLRRNFLIFNTLHGLDFG